MPVIIPAFVGGPKLAAIAEASRGTGEAGRRSQATAIKWTRTHEFCRIACFAALISSHRGPAGPSRAEHGGAPLVTRAQRSRDPGRSGQLQRWCAMPGQLATCSRTIWTPRHPSIGLPRSTQLQAHDQILRCQGRRSTTRPLIMRSAAHFLSLIHI